VNAHDASAAGGRHQNRRQLQRNIAGLNASKFRVKAGNGFGGGLPAPPSRSTPLPFTKASALKVDTNAPVAPANGAITAGQDHLQQQGVSGVVANAATAPSTSTWQPIQPETISARPWFT